MIWLWNILVYGHFHKWEETGREPLYGETWDGKGGRIGSVVFCTCKSCGKPTAFKVKG